mmetsp:Transcript_108964/g.293033  ORF Transcript_108964/g.293033 Transcript_108964/m.293033 type:complete len:443 (+) Transcript_108964:472-1800(+)
MRILRGHDGGVDRLGGAVAGSVGPTRSRLGVTDHGLLRHDCGDAEGLGGRDKGLLRLDDRDARLGGDNGRALRYDSQRNDGRNAERLRRRHDGHEQRHVKLVLRPDGREQRLVNLGLRPGGHEHRLVQLGQQLGGHDQRLVKLGLRLGGYEQWLVELGLRPDGSEHRLAQLVQRLDGHDQRLFNLGLRFGGHEQRLAKLSLRLGSHERRLAKLGLRLNSHAQRQPLAKPGQRLSGCDEQLGQHRNSLSEPIFQLFKPLHHGLQGQIQQLKVPGEDGIRQPDREGRPAGHFQSPGDVQRLGGRAACPPGGPRVIVLHGIEVQRGAPAVLGAVRGLVGSVGSVLLHLRDMATDCSEGSGVPGVVGGSAVEEVVLDVQRQAPDRSFGTGCEPRRDQNVSHAIGHNLHKTESNSTITTSCQLFGRELPRHLITPWRPQRQGRMQHR